MKDFEIRYPNSITVLDFSSSVVRETPEGLIVDTAFGEVFVPQEDYTQLEIKDDRTKVWAKSSAIYKIWSGSTKKRANDRK